MAHSEFCHDVSLINETDCMNDGQVHMIEAMTILSIKQNN